MAQDKAQRTEKPTGKRLQKARDEGNIPRTKELSGALVLLSFLLFGRLFGAAWLDRMLGVIGGALSTLADHELTMAAVQALVTATASATAGLLVLPLGLMMVAGVGGNVLQSPPMLTFKPFQPDLKKLNPISGIKKVVKLRSWVEMLKTLFKMVLFTTIAVYAVRQALAEGLPGSHDAAGAFLAIATLCADVILRVAGAALVLAFFDWLFNRYDHTRQLMMTKQEVKDERKESEGDPLIKARLKSKQMALSRSRMMADVPKATVVITNPTHYAVAIRYVPGETDVPKVLAKGRGKIAQRIREIAGEHKVPIISDPPLARALFRAVEVGSYVPPALFRAVAEVLALVLRGGRSR